MKILKKIVFYSLLFFIAISIGGYLYFSQKFSPPENYLTVSYDSKLIPIKWAVQNDNPNAALLLPIRIQDIEKEFYMQLDFGSPVTVFYKKSLTSIHTKFPDAFILDEQTNRVSMNFQLNELNVFSQNFNLLNYGNEINFENEQNIIGTIGTDLLEKRNIILDFKNNTCLFQEKIISNGLTEFKFKKRRILLPVKLGNKTLNLLYDSGTSGYELITDENNWHKLKVPNGKIKTEKGNSWGKELSIISAPAHQEIKIANVTFHLSEVTYITGTSSIQNFLMKSSGMQGMIGNKIFLNHKVIIDCKNEQFKIE